MIELFVVSQTTTVDHALHVYDKRRENENDQYRGRTLASWISIINKDTCIQEHKHNRETLMCTKREQWLHYNDYTTNILQHFPLQWMIEL